MVIGEQIHQLVMEAVDPMHKKDNHSVNMLGKPDDTGAIGGLSLVAAVTWFGLSSTGAMITAPLSEAMASRA